MKVLAFGGSNSADSINKKLAHYTAGLLTNHEVENVDINDFELPIYSKQEEAKNGIPATAKAFAAKVDGADLLLISMAENNGSYNVGFKNLLDWMSRMEGRKTWGDKKMFLMATSPGARGGQSVLQHAMSKFPFLGAEVIGTYSLPEYDHNFDEKTGITNEALLKELKTALKDLL